MDKAIWSKENITWIASFPKSGNTWVRMLLHAYRCGGYINPNDIQTGHGDSSAAYMRSVSSLPLADLGEQGQLLLRPAALLVAAMSMPLPRIMKTHFANLKPRGIPAYIPAQFTNRAVYIVRDPRDVVTSFGKFFGFGLEKTCDVMNDIDRSIGGGNQTAQVISSWSNNVKSWIKEEKFPVKVVRYEDLIVEPEAELEEILKFLEWEVNRDLIEKAVQACRIEVIQEFEEQNGFSENGLADERGRFFNAGGSRWKEELGPKWIRRIEEDHGEVMKALEYV